jgi:hypothetical protein
MAKYILWIAAFLLALFGTEPSEAVEDKAARVRCTFKSSQKIVSERNCTSTHAQGGKTGTADGASRVPPAGRRQGS